MKIHYFQRYHQAENVATANTMLLLSRFYSYSPDKFFQFLKSNIFPDGYEPEIVFNIQEKSKNSVPDATITQDSFKVVIETKLKDWFYSKQLLNHLESFHGEKLKILLTLSSELMEESKKVQFEEILTKYNNDNNTNIIHYNTTFELVAQSILDELDERDYEMHDILEDYMSYCYDDQLIKTNDAWKYMRVQLAGTTMIFNSQNNLYYNDVSNGFRPHDYLGLYHNKSVRYIGKIYAVAIARYDQINKTVIIEKAERGKIGESEIEKINLAIDDGRVRCGYSMEYLRYFFVEQFCETNFRKSTLYAPRGSRIFNLDNLLEGGVGDKSVETIASELTQLTWQ